MSNIQNMFGTLNQYLEIRPWISQQFRLAMLRDIPEDVKKICIHTGNILNLNEVKKKAGQNPTDELIESLKIALKEKPRSTDSGICDIYSQEGVYGGGAEKVSQDELTTGVKLFIYPDSPPQTIVEAVEKLLPYLEMECIDSLVLANPGPGSDDGLRPFSEAWSVLEECVTSGKLKRIGVSDIDTDTFIQLYNSAKVKPSIVQINLATCCVVPPQLQEFTKQHEVQLLTHNDPKELLPSGALGKVCGVDASSRVKLDWAARFQSHVKCRGVLAAKGYLVCLRIDQ